MTTPEPSVIRWYRLYCGFMVVLYVACVIGGALALQNASTLADAKTSELEWRLLGGLLFGSCIFLAGAFFAAFFLPLKQWAWIYHLVLICIGMGGFTAVFSIPLLLHWIKPEIQSYYSSGGRIDI